MNRSRDFNGISTPSLRASEAAGSSSQDVNVLEQPDYTGVMLTEPSS